MFFFNFCFNNLVMKKFSDVISLIQATIKNF